MNDTNPNIEKVENSELKIKRIKINKEQNSSHNRVQASPTSQNFTLDKKNSNLNKPTNLNNNELEQNIEQVTEQVPFKVIDSPNHDFSENTRNLSSDRSNRNSTNDDTIVKDISVGYDTHTLKKYLKKDITSSLDKSKSTQSKKKPWEIDRENGAKVYELIGYTTVGKINHVFQKERRQIILKRILITILLVSIILLGLIIINPINNKNDFKKILGIDSKYGKTETTETLAENPENQAEPNN